MNFILCILAASILVNVVLSGKTLEQETGEIKKILEEIKGRWESMKQKVTVHPELVADAAKITETLNSSEKVFAQQMIKEQKEENMYKGILISVKDKLPEVITTLGAIKKEAKSNDSLQSHADLALKLALKLAKALDAALKVQEGDMNIVDLRKKAIALNAMTYNIGNHAENAKNPKKAKELQRSALSNTQEFKETLLELRV